MDDLDKSLLAELGRDARQSLAVLARRLGAARTTLQARLERLERRGVIAGYTIVPGERFARGRLRATVLLQIEPRANAQVLRRLEAIPEVESAHTTSGRFDLILRLATDTTEALDRTLDEIGAIPGVRNSESLVHLATRISRARR